MVQSSLDDTDTNWFWMVFFKYKYFYYEYEYHIYCLFLEYNNHNVHSVHSEESLKVKTQNSAKLFSWVMVPSLTLIKAHNFATTWEILSNIFSNICGYHTYHTRRIQLNIYKNQTTFSPNFCLWGFIKLGNSHNSALNNHNQTVCGTLTVHYSNRTRRSSIWILF